jgi:hypothetical protein
MTLAEAKAIIAAATPLENTLIEAHLVLFADKLRRNDLFPAGPVQNTVPEYARVNP